MIRTFLTTTALATLMTAGAFAQDAAAPATDPMAAPQPFDLTQGYMSADTDDLATRIIGAPVYSSAANDADHYGDINDLVVDESGDIRAVIIGVGGFLGVGEKNVAVDFDQLTLEVAEDNTERWVLETTQEALNTAPAFEFIEDSPDATTDTAAAPADSTMAPANDAAAPATDTAAAPAADPATAPADDAAPPATDTAAAPADATAPADDAAETDTAAVEAPAPDAMGADATDENEATAIAQPGDADVFDRTTMTALETALTAEELIGTRVVGPDQQQIAEVGDIVLTEDGQVDAVLVDFGGFLGIGEKRVAVGMDNLEFLTDEAGNHYVFLENITKEQLDAAVAYDETTYAQDRDNQRLTLSAM